jgi:peroxiredoxin Q/BCP
MEVSPEMKYICVTALTACLATCLVTRALFAAEVPQAGQQAPSFKLPSQDGSEYGLKDFKGKWVVLYFYPKDMTQGCTIEAHNFQADQDKYTAKKAAIVGVSVDSVDSHVQFCTKENLTFKLLADPSHGVVEKYGSFGGTVANRNTFLIDPKGVIRKVYTGVKPQVHSTEVLSALDTLAK